MTFRDDECKANGHDSKEDQVLQRSMSEVACTTEISEPLSLNNDGLSLLQKLELRSTKNILLTQWDAEVINKYSKKNKIYHVRNSEQRKESFIKLILTYSFGYVSSDIAGVKNTFVNDLDKQAAVGMAGILGKIFFDISIVYFIIVIFTLALLTFFLQWFCVILKYQKVSNMNSMDKEDSIASICARSVIMASVFIIGITIGIVADNTLMSIDHNVADTVKILNSLPIIGPFLCFRWVIIMYGISYYGWNALKTLIYVTIGKLPTIIFEDRNLGA